MRILFCSHVPLDRRLGMGRHYLELADAFRDLGWDVRAAGPEEIAGPAASASPDAFPAALRAFLARESAAFDVAEFDHMYLPFPRGEFPRTTLMVARSMLLHHHLLRVRVPPRPGLRYRARQALGAWRRRRMLRRWVAQADRTIREADLTVVCNTDDVAELARAGHPPHKVAVAPLGMDAARRERFEAARPAAAGDPVVAFIGTFDPRKGMTDFPRIVARLPRVRFRLLGTAGTLATADEVLACFPTGLRSRLEVHPRFAPDELPRLLTGCSAGVFPSYLEGFPYGVLEMLSAGLPVVAYDAPGAPMMLPPEYLTPCGDAAAMAGRLGELLADPQRLAEAQGWARERARQFDWPGIARRTAELYLDRLAALRR